MLQEVLQINSFIISRQIYLQFIYFGEGRSRVPLFVVRVIVDISVTAIPAGAFLYHTKLMDVELPALLSDIGRNSFGSCVQLKRIRIPTNVISIRTYAFAYCQKLVEVHLPEFLQAIEDYTFFKCHSLEFRHPIDHHCHWK